MYSLYTHTNDLCDTFDSVELAIIEAIKGWHEAETPNGFTVRDEDERIAATICPVGANAAIVVYQHGEVDRYNAIRYDHDKNGTWFMYNDDATDTFEAWF